MRETGKKVGTILRRIAKVFGLLLGVLTTLSMAPYPFRGEALVPVYRVDVDEADKLAAVLTLIGFAVCIVGSTILAHGERIRIGRRTLSVTAVLGWSGVVFLSVSALSLIENATFTRKSVYIVAAAAMADDRKSFDLDARNAAEKIHDEATSIEERYRWARKFMEGEELTQLQAAKVLGRAGGAPLQEAVFATYVTALCMLKLGLFVLACALYAWSVKKG